jgi:hypothetical protein
MRARKQHTWKIAPNTWVDVFEPSFKSVPAHSYRCCCQGGLDTHKCLPVLPISFVLLSGSLISKTHHFGILLINHQVEVGNFLRKQNSGVDTRNTGTDHDHLTRRMNITVLAHRIIRMTLP